MIGVRSGWIALADVAADLPAAAYVHPVTLGMKIGDARRAAVEAWRLDRAATKISTVADRLEQTHDGQGGESAAEALRSYVRLTLPAYRLLIQVPTLPGELEPPDWPMPRMIAAMRTVRAGAGAAAQAYVGELLSSDRDSAVVTREP